MSDEGTHPLDTTPLGRSAEEVEQDSANTRTQHEGDARLTPVPPVAAPMGGGVIGVPAGGAQVLPVIPDGEDVTRPDEKRQDD